MTTSPASEAIMSDQDYCQIATDKCQGYADENLEGKPFWESIKIDFEIWTKKHWDAINGKTWSAIKGFCILCGVWIEDYKVHGSRSEILMKLVSTTKYDTKLKDWDMDRIKEVENTYGKVSRGIHLRMQKLLGNIPDEQQRFQETGFQTPPQQAVVEPLYPALSNLSPYAYRSRQSQLPQKQDPLPQPFSQQTPQQPGQSSSHQQPFVSQDVRNQRYQPTHGPQYAPENKWRHSNYQPAPTPVSNPVPNSFTSEIWKDCKCIPECSTALAPPAQVLSAQAPSTNAPYISRCSRRKHLRQMHPWHKHAHLSLFHHILIITFHPVATYVTIGALN